MEIVSLNEKEKWNRIVKSFSNWDIYYLREYAYSFWLHGDGEPLLIYHQKQDAKICYVVMQSDISEFSPFRGVLQPKLYFDWSTPYGYGGPLQEGEISDEWIKEFMQELEQYARKNGIVSQFLRFHPLLQNQCCGEKFSDVVYLKKTVYVDTTDKELIFANMTPNNRNMVRKAKKNGITIVCDHGERIEEFLEIYEATMRRNEAEEYYYFSREYFEFVRDQMSEYTIFFYALYEDKVISASIFFYNDLFMHYHLSGTLPAYRKLASANLLLSEAADWACEHGIKQFHLGGGVGIEDSLLTFKKHFNRNGLIDFCIGRTIFDRERFEELVKLRETVDPEFDRKRNFLIKYRS